MRQYLTVLVAGLLATAAFAGDKIDVPKRVAIGDLIVARSAIELKAEEDAVYDWIFEPLCKKGRCSVLAGPGDGVAHAAGTVGKHKLYMFAAIDGLDGKIRTVIDTEIIEVYSEGPTPDPPDEGLRELVSEVSASVLAEFHRDFAAEASGCKTAAVCQGVYQSQRTALGLTDADQAYVVCDARLNPLFVDPLDTAALSAELSKIATEFGGDSPDPPDPPEPESGSRYVLIVRETANDTPQRSGEFVKLRSGTAADYLTNNSHQLYILDDDAVDGDGAEAPLLRQYRSEIQSAGLPALLILDGKTKSLIKAQQLPRGFTADNVIERIRETGG